MDEARHSQKLPAHGCIKPHPHHAKLYVITVVSNPVRYESRYRLYRKFKQQMEDAGAQLITVECAFGDRPFEVTEENHPHHIQVRSWEELWHKENLINLGISRLPKDWKYVAWIDADVAFTRPDWVNETIQQLQHHHLVQLWQDAIDLGPRGELIQTHKGFAWSYCHGRKYGEGYSFWHPGYAWAARREAIDFLGGLLDCAILGAADHHMAWALIGNVKKSYPKQIHASYIRALHAWEDRAIRFIKHDIGYVPGTLVHYWHGKKKERKYVERWKILIENGFDFDLDLKRDWQGLWQLNERNHRLRDQIRLYFRQRNEDSIDID